MDSPLRDMKEVTPVEIVVDLLEIKARSERHFSVSEFESEMYSRVHFNYQYAIISHAVVMICEKYSVRNDDIEEEIRKRSHKKMREKEYLNRINNPNKGKEYVSKGKRVGEDQKGVPERVGTGSSEQYPTRS